VAEVKQREIGRPVLIILLVIVLFCGVVMVPILFDGGSRSSGTTARVTAAPTTYRVRYEVTANKPAVGLTYRNASGNSEQRDTNAPWELEFSASPGQFLYVSAQAQNKGTAVSCRIYVNGVEAQAADSHGDYVIATCSGSAGR
jgi:hypothetical protein